LILKSSSEWTSWFESSEGWLRDEISLLLILICKSEIWICLKADTLDLNHSMLIHISVSLRRQKHNSKQSECQVFKSIWMLICLSVGHRVVVNQELELTLGRVEVNFLLPAFNWHNSQYIFELSITIKLSKVSSICCLLFLLAYFVIRLRFTLTAVSVLFPGLDKCILACWAWLWLGLTLL